MSEADTTPPDPAPRIHPATIEVNRGTGDARYVRSNDALPVKAVELQHRLTLDGSTYVKLAGACDSQLASSGIDYMDAYLAELVPRNATERMLAVQMLWQHARLARLLHLWHHTTNVRHLKALDTAIDAAMNVSRQQAATWAALRSPRPVQFIAGRQVNVAGQQVVSNAPAPTDLDKSGAASNEQGSCDASPKALPAERTRFGFPEGFCVGGEALEPVYRTADVRR